MDRRMFLNRSLGMGLLGFIGLSSLSACKKIFDFSPVEGASNKQYHLNDKNVKILSEKSLHKSGTSRIALIADNHKNIDELKYLVKQINELDQQPDFVIHMGDITDEGLLFEYELTHQIMSDLSVPYLVVLGNHDCLAAGHQIYQDYYGSSDLSFAYGEDYYIILNDVIWELDNREPNFQWLEDALKQASHFRNTYVFSHIPPYTDQFTPQLEDQFRGLMEKYQVKASIHGHQHHFIKQYLEEESTIYYQVPFAKLNAMVMLDISDKLDEEHLEF